VQPAGRQIGQLLGALQKLQAAWFFLEGGRLKWSCV
jgi:hypothetical protein